MKYINVDDDDIVENDDEIEGGDDSREVNMVLNYTNTLNKNKNMNRISFNKRNQNKNNNDISSNNIKNIDNKSTNIETMNNNSKENKKATNENKLKQSQNINTIQKFNNKDANDIINDLLINPEIKNDTIENHKISKTVSNLTKEKTNDSSSNKYIISNTTRASNKKKNKNNDTHEYNTHTNLDKKNKILKKFNTKFGQLNSVKNFTLSTKYVNNTINPKENNAGGKSDEKLKIIKYEVNKNKSGQTNRFKKEKTNNNNAIKINDININDSEKESNDDKNDNKEIKNIENIETIKISLNDDQDKLDEEIDAVINLDKKRSKTKTYNTKTMEKSKINKNNPSQFNLNKKDNKKTQFNLNKKDNKKTNSFILQKIKNTSISIENNKNSTNGESNSEKNNLQNLYNELSNSNFSTNKNEDSNLNSNSETLEQKVVVILDKLDNLIDPNDKLIFFQYLFNYFNTILTDIKSISQNTIKKYKDIHIENLKENDSNLVEQVIKNLMRMNPKKIEL